MKPPKETRAEVTIGGETFRAIVKRKTRNPLQKLLGLWFDVGKWVDDSTQSGDDGEATDTELP